MALSTGTMRGMAQMSCRPPMVMRAASPLLFTVCCSREMEGMGLTATRKTSSCPLAMPPRMPPALLDKNPSGVMGSLFALPVSRAAAKPAPTSTPFTAPTPMRA